MKFIPILGAMFLAGQIIAADSNPKDDVTKAATALGNQKNYSWHTAVESPTAGRFNGPTDGKTEKGGATWLSMTRGDATIEAAISGTNGVIKTPDAGWQTVAEATADNGGGFSPATFAARTVQGFKAPAAEAADLAASAKALTAGTNGISGELTEDGAKALLAFRRGGNGGGTPTVASPKGSVTFWVKDGQLMKYQTHVSGTVTFNGNDREVDRTTTTEIKDVNSTKVEIPADAKKKMP